MPIDFLSLVTWAVAPPPFPRGPGFYFNLVNVVCFVLVFLPWVKICWWVDSDARRLELGPATWNMIVCGCGMAGFLLTWWSPYFWPAFLFLLGLAFAPSVVYANVRNQKVPVEQRVLTRRHIHIVLARIFHLKMPHDHVEESHRLIRIRFIGKSAADKDNSTRIARAESSKGYKTALEMVYDAITRRVTDIHMEPTKEEMAVRFRIDGMLQAAEPMSRATGDGIISIFKVLADMNITEKRKPQDGSFSAEVDEERVVDFRVATSGSVVGEKLVLRILDKTSQVASLRQIGMRERLKETVRSIALQPYGMFIVCGPTGAGKSTTLYACMNEIDRFTKNVITLENPVEYQIANVTQIEVNPKAGKTFATELRSILRQDPDVIYVGEIRDQETAEIACQAAQTGHMVFTTLHANDTVTAVARLMDLKVAPFLVSSALSAVLGQRLVRVLCPKCKVAYKPDAALLRQAGLPADKVRHLYRPPEAGERDEDDVCEHCGGTGYHGRTGVFELLVVTDHIKELIRENVNLMMIKQEAVKNGMRFLSEDAFRQVIDGTTSIQEVLRVCK